jgi:hypothetical protein
MLNSLFWPRYKQSTRITKSTHKSAFIHYWHVSICPNVTPRLVSRNEINQRQRVYSQIWRLVPHWRLLQIACQPLAL